MEYRTKQHFNVPLVANSSSDTNSIDIWAVVAVVSAF